MKAQKVVVVIKMEALSIDCLNSLVTQAIQNINNQYENGELSADDGDMITWSTQRTDVEF